MSTAHPEPQAIKTKKPWWRRKRFMVPAGILILPIVLGLIFGEPTETDDTASTPTPTATAPATPTTEASLEPPTEETSTDPTTTTRARPPAPAPEETAPERTRESTPEPTPEPEPEPADPLEVLAALRPVEDVSLDPVGNLFVTIGLTEGWSGPSRVSATLDTVDVLRELQGLDLDYERVAVHGYFDTVDQYGNPTESLVLNAVYLRETVERINYDGIVWEDIWTLRDSGGIHPDLEF